jgi:tetratricopeptide (TPR) repeat protein
MRPYFSKLGDKLKTPKPFQLLKIILIIKICFCFGQQNKFHTQIDSLLKLSRKGAYYNIKALSKADSLSKKHNYERGTITVYYNYSDHFMRLNKYDSAGYYLDKTYSIIQKKRNYEKLKKNVLTNKATINAKNGLYTKALFLYRKAYKIAINNKMEDTLLLKLNIFNIFNELGK